MSLHRHNNNASDRRENNSRLRATLRTAVQVALALSIAPLAYSQSDSLYELAIEPKRIDAALKEFAEQTGLQVLVLSEHAGDIVAPRVAGRLTDSEALSRLLRDTGLVYEKIDDRTIAVRPAAAAKFEKTSYSASPSPSRFKVAQAEPVSDQDGMNDSQLRGTDDNARSASVQKLEEVVVTGSHIRGVQNLSSPVISFDRKDIEASGYATTQQLLSSLPQNLNNSSDMTFGGDNGGVYDIYGLGSGVNLRGLGSDATLVLLNGRRLAAAGIGNYVDVSLIPLGAIERVDVLTDGASAIYGSDAVGGVVNLILRKDFEGAETRLRYGTVTQGNHDELQAGQSIGHAWDSGRALVSYEYYERTKLDATDRSFTPLDGVQAGLELIPEQNRHGFFAALSQDFSSRLQLNTDMFYGTRASAYSYNIQTPGILYTLSIDADVEQIGGSLGLNWDLGRDWRLTSSGVYDGNRTEQVSALDGRPAVAYDNEFSLWSLDIKADGPLTELPGGALRLALGAQMRGEKFTEKRPRIAVELERDIASGYAELVLPWVTEKNRRSGVERFEVTVAGRFEDYSDFGQSFSPKAGLAWSPIRSLNLRTTWGTSFKAPLLHQMNPADIRPSVYNLFVEPSGELTTAAFLEGSGVNLGPEESENWTAGFDFVPAGVLGLDLHASYFRIDYKDRIQAPINGAEMFSALALSYYAPFVTRDPDPALVRSFFEHPMFYTWGDPAPSPEQVAAIVDGRLVNIAGKKLSGLDLSAAYRWSSGIGDVVLNVGGTHMLDVKERVLGGAPTVSRLNNVWDAVDLRLRSSVSLKRNALNATLFSNYTDSYNDSRAEIVTGPGKRSKVASWTTFDLTLSYDLGFRGRVVDNATLTLSGTNIFDRDPPFVASPVGVHFDGVNATALGRFVALQFAAQWGR